MSHKVRSRSNSPLYQNTQSIPNNKMFTQQEYSEQVSLLEVLTILSCLVYETDSNIIQFEHAKLPTTPSKDLLSVTSAWTKKSEKIADLLRSSGIKANQNSTIIAYVNFLPPIIHLTDRLKSVLGNEISSSLLSPISPYLGRAVQYFYKYIPHCFLAYIVGYRLYSLYKVRTLLKMCRENEKLFNEMKKIIIEREVLDENIEQIFFNKGNEAIVNQVDDLFSHYRSCIYTTGMFFLVVVMIAPSLIENPAFLYKLFAFSNSETAGRYHQRFYKDEDPYTFTTPLNTMGGNSLGLSLLLETTVNVRESHMKRMAIGLIPTTIPHYALGAATILDFHYAYREFNTVVKDKKYSLYEALFASTKSRLREVNNFMRRYSAGI